MSADRSEKLSITRSLNATVVKLTVVEDGITVNYSVKTYEHNMPQAIRDARAGVRRFQAKAREA
jgi:uncharacterized protein YebE (UPF0316 family)